MKTSVLYAWASVIFLGLANGQEPCVEGKRVPISPGYTVEWRCNKFRRGPMHSNIQSHEDCATKCQVANLEVCTYHAASKKCLVGDPNGGEGISPGATYMARVPEETCEEERDGLRRRVDELENQLDTCRANCRTPSPSPAPAPAPPPTQGSPRCGINMAATGQYRNIFNVNIGACMLACHSDPRCLSYSSSVPNSPSICSLYDKESENLQFQSVSATFPQILHYDKRCR
ncbi:hypothetical protein FACUT_14139 [Fusarium acutatum]|uniref:Apple domain-containing protein n=1 Tax=Fusarium acutatum TaxID=78861 RepID=A0A8H4JAG9_9HYPO|nr:hypothetical protein FACUT_14139 [Fusarium acutatum]